MKMANSPKIFEGAVKHGASLYELPDAIYWPFKRLPETKLETYATACLGAALKYSEDARQIYSFVVLGWELPGCQVLISDFVRCKPDMRDWLRGCSKAVVRNEPPPAWPKAWVELTEKVKDNADFYELLKLWPI